MCNESCGSSRCGYKCRVCPAVSVLLYEETRVKGAEKVGGQGSRNKRVSYMI